MLKLRGDGFIDSPQRPAIMFLSHTSNAGGEKRLNGENQTFVENAAVVRVVIVQDLVRRFVKFMSNAVTGQIIDDVISAFLRFSLDCAADTVQGTAGFSGV